MMFRKKVEKKETDNTIFLGKTEVKVKHSTVENILKSVFGTPDTRMSTDASIEYLLARNNLMQGIKMYIGNPFITNCILASNEEGLSVDAKKINKETADVIVRYALFGTTWEDAV